MKTKFELELQDLKSHDEVQMTVSYPHYKGFEKIITAGHGYLIVPTGSEHYAVAKKICEYGFKGKYALYLEEDCEATEFLEKI